VKKQDVEGKTVVCKEYELTANSKEKGQEEAEIYEHEVSKTFGNEKGKLVIQSIGIMVLEFLMRHFTDFFSYDFTRQMEEELDQVAKGEKPGHQLCRECDNQLENQMSQLKEVQQEKKIEYRIDEKHTYIIGKHGPVIKKTIPSTKGKGKGKGKPTVSFLSLKPDLKIDFSILEKGGYRLEDLVSNSLDQEDNDSKDTSLGEWEGDPVFLKKGKFGLYLSYGEKGSLTKSLSDLGNRPLENITWEEIRGLLEKGDASGSMVRKITDHLSIRKSKKGEDYLFYKTAGMKRPQFFDIKKFTQEFKEMDYRTCDAGLLLEWIRDKYNIHFLVHFLEKSGAKI
jgi:DNA topoisomerase-1